jgi:serine/threonine-protein kinase
MDERVAHPPLVASEDLTEARDTTPSTPGSLEGCWAGPYRIDALLGQGATGSVYLGEHPRIGAQVAIKVLHEDVARIPGVSDRFEREARASNMVDSPHVLHIRDFGKLDDGRDYAVMDYLRGLPLDSLVESEGPMAPLRTVRLLTQAASGLAAAHQSGVLHRDIKPSNLFVTVGAEGEHLFILDFGIAKLLESHVWSATQTEAGVLVGTPGYCAPEQALQQNVGPAADVYALATVAYEMLTGVPLFEGASVVELLADKVRTERVDLSGLPEGTPALLVYLLERMLSRDPAGRPSMWEVESQLHSILDALLPPLSVPPGEIEANERPSLPSTSRSQPSSTSPVLDIRPSVSTRLGLAPPPRSSAPPGLECPPTLRPVAAQGTAHVSPRRLAWIAAFAALVVVGLFVVLRPVPDETQPAAFVSHVRSAAVSASASHASTPRSSTARLSASPGSAPPVTSAATPATTPATTTVRPPRASPSRRTPPHEPPPIRPPAGLVDPFEGK